jgi:integrase
VASIRKRTWKSGGVERTAWVCDYFDQAGKRRLKTFVTKKEADAWAVTARHEVKTGIHTPASVSVTVTEAFTRWIVDCEANGLERGTIVQRQGHLRHHVTPFIGGEKLSTLTMPRIRQFDADLRQAGRSLAMRRKVLTNLKTALTFAQGQGLVAQNVASGVKIRGDARSRAAKLKAGVDFPTKEEIRTLLDNAPERWRAFFVVAVFTGLRASELRGLRWSDIDLDGGKLTVSQRADAWFKIGAPKSAAGKRDVPLVPMAINALRQWKSVCPVGESGLAFPNDSGNVEGLPNIQRRVWDPLQVKCGLTDAEGFARYRFHSLRHAAASLFIAHLGWTPKRVQEVLGHASITMTFDRYGHMFADPEGDREAMRKLEAAIVAA